MHCHETCNARQGTTTQVAATRIHGYSFRNVAGNPGNITRGHSCTHIANTEAPRQFWTQILNRHFNLLFIAPSGNQTTRTQAELQHKLNAQSQATLILQTKHNKSTTMCNNVAVAHNSSQMSMNEHEHEWAAQRNTHTHLPNTHKQQETRS